MGIVTFNILVVLEALLAILPPAKISVIFSDNMTLLVNVFVVVTTYVWLGLNELGLNSGQLLFTAVKMDWVDIIVNFRFILVL